MSPLSMCSDFACVGVRIALEDSRNLQKALQALANTEGWIKGSPSPMII